MKIIYLHHAHRDVSKGQNQENGLTKLGVKEAETVAEMFKGREA
jgi:phosphohistidine phosphatase SixA